jgi:hypothetical protein
MTKKLREGQLFVLATRRSRTPEVLDQENVELVRRAQQAVHGILIAAPPYCDNAYALTGVSKEEGPDMRQVSTVMHSSPPEGLGRHVLTAAEAEQAAMLGLEFHARVLAPHGFEKVKRGFAALLRAISESRCDFQHHQYVRSIEAFVKTVKGAGTSHFIHRCRTFVQDNQRSCELLREIYEIRCKVEHLHPFGEALQEHPETDRGFIADQRLRQAASLAHKLYETLAMNPRLDQHFESDPAIDAFWALPDGDRKILWPRGARIDLSAIP